MTSVGDSVGADAGARVVEAARVAFGRRAWRNAYARYTEYSERAALPGEDLDRVAVSAYLSGAPNWDHWWTRAHQEHERAGRHTSAARCAFWLAFGLLDRGEIARGNGWLRRAHKLVDDEPECAERGYLLVPQALSCLAEQDHAAALDLFTRVSDVGERCGDADLRALGCVGRGQVLVELGRAGEGLPLLDEAIVAATEDELSPMVAGLIFCAAIEVCHAAFDLRRAQEWTAALARWCDAQPGLVPYRGQCLVHQAELLHLKGEWASADEELQRACLLLEGRPAAGDAHYRRGELHRVRGELAAAEDQYRAATRAGREPQPGLALLRLAQGDIGLARAAIERLVAETAAPGLRAAALGPFVEVALAGGDVPGARRAADELRQLAASLVSPFVNAVAGQALGAVLLAEGDPAAAMSVLRPAWTQWRALEAPYEAARVRLLVAAACRGMGDTDTAAMELDAARAAFEQLGAAGELTALAGPPAKAAPYAPLTAREVEILALVAHGRTNRQIAGELFISEKTVARHVSNILTKLELRSRSAATAWAWERGLV